MTMQFINIGAAVLNQIPLAWAGNRTSIRSTIAVAHQTGCVSELVQHNGFSATMTMLVGGQLNSAPLPFITFACPSYRFLTIHGFT